MNRRDALRALAGLPMIAALPAPTVTYQLRKNGVAVSPIVSINAATLREAIASERFRAALARAVALHGARAVEEP